MKKVIIPVVSVITVLVLLLCPLSAAAASGYQVSTSLLLTPVIRTADSTDLPFIPTRFTYKNGNQVGIPSTTPTYADGVAYYGTRPSTPDDPYYNISKPLGDSTNPYWCGINSFGAFTFGNFWVNNDYRYAPSGDIDSVRLSFQIGASSYSAGDVIRFSSSVDFQYAEFYEKMNVYLIPYFNDGYGTIKWNIYSADILLTRPWDNFFDVEGILPTLTYLPHNSTDTIRVDSCDGFILSVEFSGYRGTGHEYSSCYVQFSPKSEFSIVSQDAAEISGKLDSFTAEQMKTNEYLKDLSAEQEKTNEILTEEKYEGADTSTTDEFTGAEEQLMEDTAQGREDVESIMSVDSFMDNLNKLMPGILAATQIMDLCFDTIAPLQTLTYIALALGFVSFVLGTINMVVGSVRSANQRKERQAKTDAYREKMLERRRR